MDILLVKNNSNGIESPFTQEQWDKIKDDPRYRDTFTLVGKPKAPKEVEEMKAKSHETVATQDSEKATTKK